MRPRRPRRTRKPPWWISTHSHCATHHHRLPARVTYHAVDGYFAKKKYIDEVVDLRRHPITKLRGDADGRFLFTGPHPTRRGAHRKYDGKVHWQDLSRFEALGTLAGG